MTKKLQKYTLRNLYMINNVILNHEKLKNNAKDFPEYVPSSVFIQTKEI